jgi:hypothetical protein
LITVLLTSIGALVSNRFLHFPHFASEAVLFRENWLIALHAGQTSFVFSVTMSFPAQDIYI